MLYTYILILIKINPKSKATVLQKHDPHLNASQQPWSHQLPFLQDVGQFGADSKGSSRFPGLNDALRRPQNLEWKQV